MRPLSRALLLGLAALSLSAPAHARECYRQGAGQFYSALFVCASSVLPGQKGNSYGPENLIRGPAGAAWCEGAPGNGLGSTITLQFEGNPVHWRTLYIRNGYQKNSRVFADNARARDMTLSTDDGVRFRFTLADRQGEQRITLPRWSDSREVTLRVDSAYAGRRFQDLCLSEIALDLEEGNYR